MLKAKFFGYITILSLLSLNGIACKKAENPAVNESSPIQIIDENFEKGTKSSYAEAEVQLNSGSWIFNDALIGNLAGDAKNGLNAVRLRNNGYIYSNFKTSATIKYVSLKYAKYGDDADGKFIVLYSVAGDDDWKALSDTILANNVSLNKLELKLNISGEIRFKILKVDGNSNRINIDDFLVTGLTTGSQGSSSNQTVNHILLGNPSNASVKA